MHHDSSIGGDDTLPDTIPDWLDADDLFAMGVDEEDIARLPIGHRGNDGRPCWHHEALPVLLGTVGEVRP